MTEAEEARERRAAGRSSWPIRRLTLAEEGQDSGVADCTGDERLAMMWTLAVDAWASSGNPWPEYARADAPGTVIRPGNVPA